jgi:antitoxin ParD1/3/4
MNVSLTPQLEKFVQEKVESGLYNSASEVIREALRLLEEKDRFRQIRMEELKKQVSEGVDALDRGDYIELDEDGLNHYMENVIKRGRERLAKKKPAAK